MLHTPVAGVRGGLTPKMGIFRGAAHRTISSLLAQVLW